LPRTLQGKSSLISESIRKGALLSGKRIGPNQLGIDGGIDHLVLAKNSTPLVLSC
jgi:hypothetical protein